METEARDSSARAASVKGRRAIPFALRRRLPHAWMEPKLRQVAGDGPAVVLAEKSVFEAAVRAGDLSPEAVARLRPLEEGVANEDEYLLLEWTPPAAAATPPAPHGAR